MQGEVVDGVTQYRLLDKENIASALLDLLAYVQEVLAFFLEDLVHLAVVVDDNLVVHLG
jgi:NTP pyrophosphatase (non-canonical NTP hydrolase)